LRIAERLRYQKARIIKPINIRDPSAAPTPIPALVPAERLLPTFEETAVAIVVVCCELVEDVVEETVLGLLDTSLTDFVLKEINTKVSDVVTDVLIPVLCCNLVDEVVEGTVLGLVLDTALADFVLDEINAKVSDVVTPTPTRLAEYDEQ
jgi:hypothetical protein